MQKESILPHLIQRHGNFAFCAYMAGAVVFLFLIDSVFNGGFGYAVKVLWLPAAAAIFGTMGWHRRTFYRISGSRWKPWLVAALLYPMLLLMSWPYLMAVNAVTSPGQNVIYAGPVVRKWISRGRTKQNLIVLFDRASGQRVTLPVSTRVYDSVTIGKAWQESYFIGGLGIPFRWRYGKQPHL